MDPVLLGDIGGTHSRFALTDEDGGVSDVRAYTNDEIGSLEAAISDYLASVGTQPRDAVLAVAAVVTGPEIALTNRSWRFRLDDLKRRFSLTHIQAINDFEAQAWALLSFTPADLRRIGGAADVANGPKAVLGPGTGLGVAALVPDAHVPHVIATEAGHTSFGAASADEDQVFARLRRNGPVSAEMVLSGPGLERLHAALHPAAAPATSEAIVDAAKAGKTGARETTRMFVRLLGRFAGDIALVFRATAGVYLSGGVAQALDNAFDDAAFREAFIAHPPYADLLARIPTYLITHPQPGLLGGAVLAKRLQISPSSANASR
jgi:glucokinase